MQKSIQYILMTPREFQFGWYAQDRWQVTRKLTLTMGLRHEYYPLMTRATGKGIERLDPETNQVFLGGRGNVPRNVGVTVSKRLFAPTLGMAYCATDKTVIRAGYGIHYDPLPFSRPLRGFYPLTVNFAFNAPNGFTHVRTLAEGIPPVVGRDLSTGIVNLPAVADMRSPYAGQIHRGYIQSWNLTVERRLPLDPGLRPGAPPLCGQVQPACRDQHVGWLSQLELPFAAEFHPQAVFQGRHAAGFLHVVEGHQHDRRRWLGQRRLELGTGVLPQPRGSRL